MRIGAVGARHMAGNVMESAQDRLGSHWHSCRNDRDRPMKNIPDGGNAGHGDLLVVARFFSPTDAYLLQSCLEAHGVPAVVADAHLVQANQFLTTAVGGVRVLVPQSHFEQGMAVRKAFDAGEYQLDDDFDVGEEVK